MRIFIDCDSCIARGLNCGDCMVTALEEHSVGPLVLTSDEFEALSALSDVRLLPPLRLVPLVAAAG